MSELIIYDPEDQKNYTVVLNEDDYNRALEDEQFLATLLEHAKTVSITHSQEDNLENIDINEPGSSTSLDKKVSSGHWDCQQTKALIKSMATHISDLNNVKKRKYVFDNVANDLLSIGFNVTPAASQNKWKSLVRSYQKCKDLKTRTGQGPSRFYFFEEMDEVLGLKPTNECSHSLNSSFNSQQEDARDEQHKENNEPLETTSQPTKTSEKNTLKKRKLPELKVDYIQKKIKSYEDKERRHKEKMEMEKKRQELEERKISLLEALVKKKD